MKLIKLFLILMLVVFPFGQLGRVDLWGAELVLHINDLIIGIFVLFWFFGQRKILSVVIYKDPLFKPLLFFAGAVGLSILVNFNHYSFNQLLVSILYPLRFFVFAGLYFVIKNLPDEDKKLLRIGLVFSVSTVAIFGLLQYSLLPDASFLKAAAWDDHFYRLVAPFLDPGFTGAILVLGLLAIFSFQFSIFKKITIMLILFIALMLTYSRASYLMYLVSFAVISWYRKSANIFLIAIITLLIAIPLLPKSSGEGTKLDRENSSWARVNNWKESVTIWKASPLFGVGFNSYRYVRGEVNLQSHAGAGADSSILLVLATTGIVGLLTYLYLFRTILVESKNNALVIASLAGLFVHSWFNNTLFYPWIMEWLWIMIALSPSLP